MKAIREYQIALLATAGFNQIHRHVIAWVRAAVQSHGLHHT
jgi:23S rRNA maturation mini-RNase III